MKRRNFIQKSAGAVLAIGALSNSLKASVLNLNEPFYSRDDEELKLHKIDGIEYNEVQLKFPRQAGKNATKNIAGFGQTHKVATLKTDRGATGWGIIPLDRNDYASAFESIKGKPVTDFFLTEKGITKNSVISFDIPIHDLAGQILQKPVYKFMGNETPQTAPCYSGMIYFDDLELPTKSAGLDKILEECQYDINYGYRQLKAKMGRGKMWLKGEEGLKRDIEVTKLIAKNFPDIDILVDGNDGFTVNGIIEYLKGIEGIPLFWLEEPFKETIEDYRILRNWTKSNASVKYLADGELDPDMDLLARLEDLKLIDVCLMDIIGYGFTPWRTLMPELKKRKILAGPHNWSSFLKTLYTVQLVGAYGNTASIEGVTCTSDDIDFGDYKLVDGRYTPSNAPGFGLKLLKKNNTR
jgi:D-galactarolactone cycloisomerase